MPAAVAVGLGATTIVIPLLTSFDGWSVLMGSDITSLHSEGEQRTTASCPVCGRDGDLWVSRFVWAGERHLQWHCYRCRNVWVTHDPREMDRDR